MRSAVQFCSFPLKFLNKEYALFVHFSVKGEYEDYFGMKLTEEEYKIIQKFLNEFNANVNNVSIKEIKKD